MTTTFFCPWLAMLGAGFKSLRLLISRSYSSFPDHTALFPYSTIVETAIMFEDFELIHLPVLLFATVITHGGLRPFTHGPKYSMNEFGFTQQLVDSEAAYPLIKIGSSRITAIGLAIWGMYLAGQLKAIDILLASFAWQGVIDWWVLYKEGAGSPGSARFRVIATILVVLWGVLGMTSGKYIWEKV